MAPGFESTLTTDVARVRDVLMRELETITRYETLAAQADSQDVKNFFLHLAAEEKEHVAEAVMLMQQLDPGLAPHFAKPLDLTHFGAVQPERSGGPPPRVSTSLDVNGVMTQPGKPPAYVPEDLRIPRDPTKMAHALPAPPHPSAGELTVGSLRRRAP